MRWKFSGIKWRVDHLVQHVGAHSRTVSFTYGDDGLMQELTYAGRTWRYTWGGVQNDTTMVAPPALKEVHPPEGGAWLFSYTLHAVLSFLAGGVARTYMNIIISRSSLSGGSRSTERRYSHLIREQGVPRWPLLAAVTLIPLGILLAFASIVWSNYAAVG